MTLEELKKESSRRLVRAVRMNSWLSEDDHEFNDIQREIIKAMREEHGEAWLGKINLTSHDEGKLVIWRWNGKDQIYNFECAFVIPRYDHKLYELIMNRHNATYEGTRKDSKRLDPIMDRITELGGVHLVWS